VPSPAQAIVARELALHLIEISGSTVPLGVWFPVQQDSVTCHCASCCQGSATYDLMILGLDSLDLQDSVTCHALLVVGVHRRVLWICKIA
jgi:hypothetical protein